MITTCHLLGLPSRPSSQPAAGDDGRLRWVGDDHSGCSGSDPMSDNFETEMASLVRDSFLEATARAREGAYERVVTLTSS